MEDIFKSALLGIVLIVTLTYAAPILNETEHKEVVSSSESVEQKTEKEIHIPL